MILFIILVFEDIRIKFYLAVTFFIKSKLHIDFVMYLYEIRKEILIFKKSTKRNGQGIFI